MTSTVTEPPITEYRQCSTCGFATPATRERCHHCWNRLDEDAPILDPDVAQDLLQRQEVFLAERASQQRARQRRRNLILGAVGLVLLAWVGWWFYRSYIYTPPPVPEASNPALQMLSGPDVWATSGGDREGSRSIDAPVPLDGAEAWSVALGGEPVTPLVADTERAYVVMEDRVAAVSIADGSVVWEFNLQGAPFASPTIAGGRLYLALRAGQLLALDAASGEPLWYSLNAGTRFGTSPIVVDGYAYVFGLGRLVAFDAETGEELWSSENRGQVGFANPAVTDDHIAGVTGSEVLVFRRDNGAQTYFYEFARAFPYSTVAKDGVIYASSRRYTVAFEETSDRPWWEIWRAGWNQFWLWGIAPSVPQPEQLWVNLDPPLADGFAATIAGDMLILGSRDGEVQALRLSDGSEVWRLPEVGNRAMANGPLTTSDGVLLPLEDRLLLVDPSTGATLDERPVEGDLRDVVVTTTGMYVLTTDGTLTAVR